MADLLFSAGTDTANSAAAPPPTSGPFDFLSMEGGAPQSEAMQFGSPSKQTAKGSFIVAILCHSFPFSYLFGFLNCFFFFVFLCLFIFLIRPAFTFFSVTWIFCIICFHLLT